MENKENRYLDELRRQLHAMPKEEREEAILEISTHIADSTRTVSSIA
ncbi:hypothetical protein [Bacillus sp. OK048]|nr:hypothetical protein [Bacillus sp. OK048]SDM85680.1 hypothetical protein SAMN05443253_10667 [Bacillus sp. OK048]